MTDKTNKSQLDPQIKLLQDINRRLGCILNIIVLLVIVSAMSSFFIWLMS